MKARASYHFYAAYYIILKGSEYYEYFLIRIYFRSRLKNVIYFNHCKVKREQEAYNDPSWYKKVMKILIFDIVRCKVSYLRGNCLISSSYTRSLTVSITGSGIRTVGCGPKKGKRNCTVTSTVLFTDQVKIANVP